MFLALRRPTGQREAIALTLYLDLSPEQAAVATRVSLARLRRRLAKARPVLTTALPSTPEYQPSHDRAFAGQPALTVVAARLGHADPAVTFRV